MTDPHFTILPADTDIADRQAHHRERFLFLLRNVYDPADTVRRQAERMADDWWPAATRSQEEVA